MKVLFLFPRPLSVTVPAADYALIDLSLCRRKALCIPYIELLLSSNVVKVESRSAFLVSTIYAATLQFVFFKPSPNPTKTISSFLSAVFRMRFVPPLAVVTPFLFFFWSHAKSVVTSVLRHFSGMRSSPLLNVRNYPFLVFLVVGFRLLLDALRVTVSIFLIPLSMQQNSIIGGHEEDILSCPT